MAESSPAASSDTSPTTQNTELIKAVVCAADEVMRFADALLFQRLEPCEGRKVAGLIEVMKARQAICGPLQPVGCTPVVPSEMTKVQNALNAATTAALIALYQNGFAYTEAELRIKRVVGNSNEFLKWGFRHIGQGPPLPDGSEEPNEWNPDCTDKQAKLMQDRVVFFQAHLDACDDLLRMWATVEASEPRRDGENVFQLDGKVWRVSYRDAEESGSFANRENSVERRLARLLAEPNRRFPALDFFAPPPGAAAILHMGRDESSDGKALNEVDKRLMQLVNEIKEAEAAHDTESANKLRDEFEKLTEHIDGEKKARKRGHKKRCGPLSPTERADQTLRVGLERLKDRFRENGLPKLANHLDKYINNSEGEWWYAPSPGTSQWNVTLPSNTFQK